jgi:hypothetical protein
MKRRTYLQRAVAAPFVPAKFAIALPAGARMLILVPQANLTLLDPIFGSCNPLSGLGLPGKDRYAVRPTALPKVFLRLGQAPSSDVVRSTWAIVGSKQSRRDCTSRSAGFSN